MGSSLRCGLLGSRADGVKACVAGYRTDFTQSFGDEWCRFLGRHNMLLCSHAIQFQQRDRHFIFSHCNEMWQSVVSYIGPMTQDVEPGYYYVRLIL